MDEEEVVMVGNRGDDEATVLKTAFGWYEMGVGFDQYGLACLPGGFRDSQGQYHEAGSDCYFLAASSNDSGIWSRSLGFRLELPLGAIRQTIPMPAFPSLHQRLRMMKLLPCISVHCFLLTAFGQVPDYLPTDGLVGWWPLDGNAVDVGPNQLDGQLVGSTSYEGHLGERWFLVVQEGAFVRASFPDLTAERGDLHCMGPACGQSWNWLHRWLRKLNTIGAVFLPGR